MEDWKKLQTYFRAKTLPKHDLRTVWMGRVYTKTCGVQPIPILRALAFQAVLENCKVIIHDDELIIGSLEGLFSDTYPAGITARSAELYTKKYNEIGRRTFQSNYDHAAVDYATLLKLGLPGIRNRAEKRLKQVKSKDEKDFLTAIIITLNSTIQFILRYAESCEARKLSKLSRICRNIAEKQPATFREALQLVWFIHLIFAIEYRGAMALGRVDQYLYSFYIRDINRRTLSRETALNLVQQLWVKLEEPGIPNTIQNICIGGVKPNGKDAVNELSYICLEATAAVKTPNSNLSARLHDKTADKFFKACGKVIRTGIGFPAVFNDEVLIRALMKKGISLKDSRDYCMVGCIETFLPGKQPPWSDSRFNILECVNHALRENTEGTYKQFISAFNKQVKLGVAQHVKIINAYKLRFPVDKYMDPFISAFTLDCIQRARDINAGGTRYPGFHGIAGMGMATAADSIASIKKLVFEDKVCTVKKLVHALDNNFEGYEILQQQLINKAPKYGNGNPYVDKIARDITKTFCQAVHKHRIPLYNGRYVPLMAANTANIRAGKETGATPDGRYAGTALSDAASPHFGRDKSGPTAIMESLSNIDYTSVTGGTVVNMKLNPSILAGEAGLARFAALLKAFVKMRLQELQFNVTKTEVMKAAQQNPGQYSNLIIRVSGFSAFFVHLSKEVQDDIIRRTEQGSGSI
ncbi:MAG: pyruvate formate lyase family protein [Elusimicrobiota bacterium]